ncbi:MAG TPA: hypothetical protein VF746_07310 [Longimicrobium sp.]|jgi:hypothetical protein
MPRFRAFVFFTVPITGAVLLAGAAAGARPAAALSLQAGETLTFATGDQVSVASWPMGASGVEVCAAITQRIRPGKTLYVQSDQGSGMPTIQRFPISGVTPYCTRLTQTAGDSVTVTFTKQVRDRVGRIARLTVGSHRMAVDPLWRRRVTFRWLREGADTVPAAPTVEEVFGTGRRP